MIFCTMPLITDPLSLKYPFWGLRCNLQFDSLYLPLYSVYCTCAFRLSSQFHLYSTLQLSACAQCNRPMTLTMTCLTLAQGKKSVSSCHVRSSHVPLARQSYLSSSHVARAIHAQSIPADQAEFQITGADQSSENLLESNGVDAKRSRLEGRNGILTWKWTLEHLDHLWLHVQMKGCRQQQHGRKFPQYSPAPPPEEHVPEMRGQGVHAKALRIRAFWSEIGRTPGCPACETPGPEKSHTHECKTYQDAWDESRRTASVEEAKRGIVGDPDTRPLDPSGSSLDPEPKRTKQSL